jgi:hypothetical protein
MIIGCLHHCSPANLSAVRTAFACARRPVSRQFHGLNEHLTCGKTERPEWANDRTLGPAVTGVLRRAVPGLSVLISRRFGWFGIVRVGAADGAGAGRRRGAGGDLGPAFGSGHFGQGQGFQFGGQFPEPAGCGMADKPAAPSATTDLVTQPGSHGPRPAKPPQADHKHPKTGSQRDQRQCQTRAPY